MAYYDSTSKPLYIDIILLVVRVFVGFAMLTHGFPKLQTLLEGGEVQFYDFLGVGPSLSLGLTVVAEFICSIFLILGLFTRPAIGISMFTMIVAAFVVHAGDGFDKRELSLLYLAIYVLLMTYGAGKLSIDGMIQKRKQASAW